MAVNLGDQPLAGFRQPIEMLKDCHRRIEHFLDVLRQVERRFGDGELSDEGRRAWEASLEYFAKAAPNHTADEERSLFPRLRGSEDADARAVMAELDHLEHEHRSAEAGHALVDRLGRGWLATGRIDEEQRSRLRKALDELARIYADHIRLEEQQVFVLAARVLQSQQLREIGEEMKQRRALGD